MSEFSPAATVVGLPAQERGPHLIRGLQADYTPAPPYPGRNVSGMRPLGPNVIVCVDECSSVTAGGLYRLDDDIEKMTMGSVAGVIYAIGKTCWPGYDDDERPHLGSRIVFDKYAGILQPGRNGWIYRIMDYKVIACIQDTEDEIEAEAA